MIENRKYYRLPFRTKFVYGAQGKVSTGNSLNVSSGGIFITSFDLYPRDTTCKCVFSLAPDEAPIVTTAVIKRVVAPSANPEEVPGLGFAFQDPDSAESQRVIDFMEVCRKNYEVAATILSMGEPDILSLQPLLANLHIPPVSDLGELRYYIERIMRGIELVDKRGGFDGPGPLTSGQ